MTASKMKLLRCAIYTRKSTEHGLELEFNSLHAQRDACEAYIKSQASLGWECIPHHYDDPAYSGGNLDRPALKKLLQDVEAGKVDVIVVYKIDRLTRSLADFAKLVEAFDAKSISFVAVTQQFNTTTSMGRLTLNVLLSFAQFERELSSERVRDKVAASRKKGKWTGGTVPFGYDVKNKKLIPNQGEAKTVRYIYGRYLHLKSIQKLIPELETKGIVSKRRETVHAKYKGGIPFTHGPLAYLLKNRIYIGEMSHKDKWYPGEHQGILDPKLFNKVQTLLKSNTVTKLRTLASSGALLMGKLFDDRGNKMSPTYSTKNGVRYRFYVSSVLFKGRKADAGSVARVSATSIEATLSEFVRSKYRNQIPNDQSFTDIFDGAIKRITLNEESLNVSFLPPGTRKSDNSQPIDVSLPWKRAMQDAANRDHTDGINPQLVQTIVRAHAWLKLLEENKYSTIEKLAEAEKKNPNVVRYSLRLAFLDPSLTEAIMSGRTSNRFSSRKLLECDDVVWRRQRDFYAI